MFSDVLYYHCHIAKIGHLQNILKYFVIFNMHVSVNYENALLDDH